MARTSPTHAEAGGRRHAGVCSVLRTDDAGTDCPRRARESATDIERAPRLCPCDGGSRCGDEDLRGGDPGTGVRRRSERVASYGSRSDEDVRGGGVGSSVRPTR